MEVEIHSKGMPLLVCRENFVGQFFHSSIMTLNDISVPRTGCVGEFATFGFLTFLISLLNTLLNLGKIKTISKQTLLCN